MSFSPWLTSRITTDESTGAPYAAAYHSTQCSAQYVRVSGARGPPSAHAVGPTAASAARNAAVSFAHRMMSDSQKQRLHSTTFDETLDPSNGRPVSGTVDAHATSGSLDETVAFH